jgi:hypothetical protein
MNAHGRRRMRIASALLCVGLASGCVGGRTVLVADDSPVRLGPHTTGMIYTLVDGEWKLSAQRVRLPEGWYCVPPRFVDPEDFEGAP